MKLYAVVDKKSGMVATETADLENITLYGFRKTAETRRRDAGMTESHDIVLVELKEVAGPCEWCDVNDGAWCATYDGRMIALDNEGSPETLLAENWSFCPNCGRRLK